MARTPGVMVSSTFFDLKQVRRDLGEFIGDELGYRPLLFELPSFPVSPDADTVENCKRRVHEDADVFVLVVGGRYGSVDDRTAKSVTNLEYLAARQKGIPIYVFVDRRIVDLLPVWADNQGGDYSRVVDTAELFRFVETIRSDHKVWTFPFESAQDIVSVLRVQLACLFHESLELSRRLRGQRAPSYLDGVGPVSLRIALEKPTAWEYRLLFQSWIDEMEKRASRLREHRVGLALGLSENVPADAAPEWFLTRSHELQAVVRAANELLSVQMNESIGALGEPGDVEHILWTTRKIGDCLQSALDWSWRIRCARVHEPFTAAAREMALFADDLLDKLVASPREYLRLVEDALAVPDTGGAPRVLKMTVTLTLANTEAFHAALDEAKRQLDE